MAADVLDELRSEIALSYQRVELATTHLDNGKFARNKKTIESDKRSNGCEFAKQYSGRIPVFTDCFSNGRRGEKQKYKVHCADAARTPDTLSRQDFTSSISLRQG